MERFRRLLAVACPLPNANVDTDQLIPARFMSRPRSEGYGPFLLHDLRRDDEGRPHGRIALDRPERRGAAILVAGRNFGSGSSREAAVYALVDFGIRCVVAPSFGDIFASNAVNNGLLPARVSDADGEALLALLEGGQRELIIDLEAQQIVAGQSRMVFEVDPVWRTKLLNGWDDLDLTMSYESEIKAFSQADAHARPWAS